MIIGKNIANQA